MDIHWLIFVTISNSAFKSRKQVYIHEIKIQKYHYFNQCIQRFAYHTSNHNYHEYKFVYYNSANATTTTTNNNNKVTGIAQLNSFSCTKNVKYQGLPTVLARGWHDWQDIEKRKNSRLYPPKLSWNPTLVPWNVELISIIHLQPVTYLGGEYFAILSTFLSAKITPLC